MSGEAVATNIDAQNLREKLDPFCLLELIRDEKRSPKLKWNIYVDVLLAPKEAVASVCSSYKILYNLIYIL